MSNEIHDRAQAQEIDLRALENELVSKFVRLLQFASEVVRTPAQATDADMGQIYNYEVPLSGWQLREGLEVYGCVIPGALFWYLDGVNFAMREDGTARDIHLDRHETFILFRGELTVRIGDNVVSHRVDDATPMPTVWTVRRGTPHGTISSRKAWLMTIITMC